MDKDALLAGRYQLLEAVGSGGFGQVWRSHDRQLGRTVAIKVLLPHIAADPVCAKQFVHEATLVADLHHHAIVPVFDAGTHDDQTFAVLEYVEGGSVAGRLDSLDEGALGRVLEDVLAALQYASDKGVVHRDLKPENLLLTNDGRTKVVDFGIAKVLGEALSNSMATPHGQVRGTPHYMAPEQATAAATIDSRSDLYSLGIIAYEALCGRRPFANNDSAMAVMFAHVNEPPPPPSTIRPDIDRGLENWLMRMLAKSPDERPNTPADAWDELEDVLIASMGPRWRRATSLTRGASGEHRPARFSRAPARADVPGRVDTPPEELDYTSPMRKVAPGARRNDLLAERYVILGSIGRGSVGTVHVARDGRTSQQVAVKVLAPELAADNDLAKLFISSSWKTSTLTHTTIAGTLDAGTDGGRVYSVSELAPGGSLRTRMSGMEPAMFGRSMHDILAALHYGVEAGVLHGNLKPENILITPDGSLRVTDFGVAVALSRRQRETAGLAGHVETPQIVSTAAYMAPEPELDHRSDLYAVGVIAYECLTGRRPFPATDDSPFADAAAPGDHTPPPLRSLRPNLSPDLERWVLWLLAPDPAHRPQTAAHAWKTLERILDHDLGRGWRGTERAPVASPAPAAATPAPAPAAARKLPPVTPAPPRPAPAPVAVAEPAPPASDEVEIKLRRPQRTPAPAEDVEITLRGPRRKRPFTE